jgi:hypothetical protein
LELQQVTGVSSTGAAVGAAVGSGFPPHAAKMTASRSRVPRSIKVFFIDIYEVLLSVYFVQEGFYFLLGRHLLR